MKTMTKAEVLEVLDGYIADLAILCGAVAPGTQTKLQQARAAVSEVYEEVDILRSSVDRMQQQWAENKPAVEYKQEVERLKRAVERKNRVLHFAVHDMYAPGVKLLLQQASAYTGEET